MRGFRAPDELGAQQRAWAAVAAAFAEREPVRRRRRPPVRATLALAAVAALVAVAFTPPGHAVLTSVRRAIGVERAQPALYRLPGGGRILAGGWLVNGDGSTRRLGDYRETSWSPFGRFVVAAKPNELVALQPDGTVRWTLARPDVRFPRWAGSHTDTRIAYLSGGRLRVVAGDGTGDHELGRAAPVAPAWRPGTSFALAYADPRGRVVVPGVLRTAAGPRPLRLAWSSDGARLLVLRARTLDVYDARGRRLSRTTGRFADAAFLPGTHRLAVLTPHAVELLAPRTVLFRTTGTLRQLVPSPDGRRLLVTWPEADQWLFVPTEPGRRLSAVGNIAEQLGGAFPVGGWTS
ncbi:MAG TPA: hypothetical protein VFL60_09400 [Gaiellaceae bacterium]|nr:hypothetical protein [Gaiellaceae bacterium]